VNHRLEQRGAVAWIWLTRPEVHNAFGAELIAELTQAFTGLAAGESTRVVVLAAEGPSFSAGADVNWMKRSLEYGVEENLADARRLEGLFASIANCPKPVIARVHGAALGGGAGLVAACDFAVAAEGAKFGFTEVRLGLVPAVISPFVLARIGPGAARPLFLTGERFDAARALRIGLVQEVVPEAGLDGAVDALVKHLLACGPKAVAVAKTILARVPHLSREEARAFTTQLIAETRVTPEAQEGLRAFLEKRKPAWA
jgi:methylglutaconyl-CoA hydratase